MTSLKTKDRAFLVLKTFFALMENKYAIKVLKLYLDNDIEYGGKKLTNFLMEKGVNWSLQHHTTMSSKG